MDWDRLREQWRQAPATLAPTSQEALQALDRKMRRRVRLRDWREFIASVVVAPFFLLTSVETALDGNWAASGFALLLVAYAVAVPLRFRAARKAVPEPTPDLPLRERLVRQRDGALEQALLLERAWLWYVAPLVVGVVGLVVSLAGVSTFSLAATASVLVFAGLLVWMNRAAGKGFRDHARNLQRQVDGPDDSGHA